MPLMTQLLGDLVYILYPRIPGSLRLFFIFSLFTCNSFMLTEKLKQFQVEKFIHFHGYFCNGGFPFTRWVSHFLGLATHVRVQSMCNQSVVVDLQ